MSDPTSRDPSRHQTLRAFKERGGNPASHPDVDLLTEVAGRQRWWARTVHRREAAAKVEDGTATPVDRWTVELLDDDALADWFLAGLPADAVKLEEQAVMEAEDRRHRPWSAAIVVERLGYSCAISGRSDSLIALELAPRDSDQEPVLLHPDEILGVVARGLQLVDEGVELTVAMGPVRRRRMLDAHLAQGGTAWRRSDDRGDNPSS